MSVDVASAEFLAALLKTLEETDDSFRERFEKHKKEVTPEELLEALRIVKDILKKGPHSDQHLREEIENFLSYRE